MSAQECLKKTYVKFRYIPPRSTSQPVDCKKVVFEKNPEIRIFTGQRSVLEGRPADEIIGIDFHCAVPSTAGAGSIIILVQVSTYIEWVTGFHSTRRDYALEVHRVFVSLPVMHKLQGPRIALTAISPWKIKILSYAGQIAAAFHKVSEVEKVLAKVVALKKGFCPQDVKTMEESLKAMETNLNLLLQGAASSDGDIARAMDRRGMGTGLFAGARFA